MKHGDLTREIVEVDFAVLAETLPARWHNPKLDAVEMRALSEPARVAVERQKERHSFAQKNGA
jgi:hypothetical protein